MKWPREQLSQGKPSQTKVSKTNQIFQTQASLTQFTLQTNFAFYSIKIRVDIAEISVGEKTTKLRPNQTIETKQTV